MPGSYSRRSFLQAFVGFIAVQRTQQHMTARHAAHMKPVIFWGCNLDADKIVVFAGAPGDDDKALDRLINKSIAFNSCKVADHAAIIAHTSPAGKPGMLSKR